MRAWSSVEILGTYGRVKRGSMSGIGPDIMTSSPSTSSAPPGALVGEIAARSDGGYGGVGDAAGSQEAQRAIGQARCPLQEREDLLS